MSMKLAEALMERSDLKARISQLSDRLSRSALVFEGEEPPEDPKRMLEDLNIMTARYEELIFKINTANAVTKTSTGETLARLIARRDSLMNKESIIRRLIDSSIPDRDDRRPDLPKVIPTVDVRSLRKEADSLAKTIRETDAIIQATNWTTEID
jgi:hypothetical protein